MQTRKIGLGVMGFADMLIELGIPYDSEDGWSWAARSWRRSPTGATRVRGTGAPARLVSRPFKDSILSQGRLPQTGRRLDIAARPAMLSDAPTFDWSLLARQVAQHGSRNATTTTIAPTGSISIIAGVSSGIEPVFALAYTRKNVLDADELPEVNPLFEKIASREGFYSPGLVRRIAQTGSAHDDPDVPTRYQRVFATAHDIAGEWHIRMQAAFQQWTDNAVSKTINFSNAARPQDIEDAYLMAYRLGCKGLTIYRDGSREAQVLNVGAEQKAAGPADASKREYAFAAAASRCHLWHDREDPAGLRAQSLRHGQRGCQRPVRSLRADGQIGRLHGLAVRSRGAPDLAGAAFGHRPRRGVPPAQGHPLPLAGVA